MILLKIDRHGDLEWNEEEINASAAAYDRGHLCDESYNAKLIKLIWESGWEAAMKSLEAPLPYLPNRFQVH